LTKQSLNDLKNEDHVDSINIINKLRLHFHEIAGRTHELEDAVFLRIFADNVLPNLAPKI
jgi:hypothetical protein